MNAWKVIKGPMLDVLGVAFVSTFLGFTTSIAVNDLGRTIRAFQRAWGGFLIAWMAIMILVMIIAMWREIVRLENDLF